MPRRRQTSYEADHLDQQTRTCWSVMVTGRATRITDPIQVARYQTLLIPWIYMDTDLVVRIPAENVAG
ncbi:pyridoxamine 5'-phosphate oxidase family protein [Streptomyces sp. NRRL S-646]|uniref:pyridoxamine 5'-phosphate oxidase family protein n=1 Tax=Streptomyces sp. NRRL S-646 TaxID=1463917 RepID=UPI00099C1286|nr:pyridoxamine 5'-phosphate oxidase family protein [Streptomyces sp. NRRL S-646]